MSRKLLVTLSVNDFKEQYLGSYLGVFWALLRPLLFIVVIWFVFEVGFKSKPTDDGIPFVLWLLSGMIPWFFFADSVSKGMNAVVESSYLVKKVAFRVSILPLVKIFSALAVHLVLVSILLFIFILYGQYPTLFWVQLPFYIFCIVVLTLGLGWLTSSLRVFIKDVGEIIAVVIQFGFWLTPIFWSSTMIPEQYQYVVKLNPMYYVVEGFRDSLINHIWFWEKGFDTIQFLTMTTFLLIVGAIVFKRLRPHFGDVL